MTLKNATEIAAGDIYRECGFQFTASDVAHDQPGNGNPGEPATRSTWTATWTGEAPDPGPGYRSFVSAGNTLRPICVEGHIDAQP